MPVIEGATVSIPAGILSPMVKKLLPPKISFGSPVQRGKNEQTSYWHIPITIRRCLGIGPSDLTRCTIFLDEYRDGQIKHKVRMAWGDAVFTATGEMADLSAGEKILVPIATRSESGNDRAVHIASRKFLLDGASEIVLNVDRDKFRFKLRVKSGPKTWATSDHFYLIRVPTSQGSNGHFTCEIEYEGEGTQP